MSKKQEKISMAEIENATNIVYEEEIPVYNPDTQMDAREAEQEAIASLVGEINDGAQ